MLLSPHGAPARARSRLRELMPGSYVYSRCTCTARYDDSRIRPWNAAAWRYRGMGKYYEDMWAAAVASQPAVVAITSYNEWGEGTQIEAAASGRVSTLSGFRYQVVIVFAHIGP